MIFYIVYGSLGLLSGILGTIYLVLHMIKVISQPPETNIGISSEHVKEFPFMELAVATNGFALGNKVGLGGFGIFYRGQLNEGSEIAVKRARQYGSSLHSQNRQKLYDSEVRLLSRIDDTNVVKLLGVCHEREERILVYNYLPKGSLHANLHKSITYSLNTWKIRTKVALGAAKGISYLHHLDPSIIHRDIKPGNILLDNNFDAVISDFGLAVMESDPVSDFVGRGRVVGTFGYIDPQCDGVPTTKNDVYAFGVVLFEILTGKEALIKNGEESSINLVKYVEDELKVTHYKHILDKRVGLPCDQNEENAVASMLETAVSCVSSDNNGNERPGMDRIVATLQSAFEILCTNEDVDVV